MQTPSFSFRLAIVSALAVLGAWYGYFDQEQHDILIMHFAGSAMGKLMIVPLPFALLAAFIGWNKGYFKKTFLIVAGCLLAVQLFNYAMGIQTKHPQIDLESSIMSVMLAVGGWFVFELVQYVKQYWSTK